MISVERAGALTPDEQRVRRWRTVWGWSATSAPVALLLTAGIALGPHGINLLTASALPFLSPIVPVALAGFGALAGLGLGDRGAVNPRIFGAATIVATIAMLIVSGGLALVASTSLTPLSPVASFAIIGGICAATSLTLPAGTSLEPPSQATRIVEAGVLVPILAGGVMLASVHVSAPVAVLTLMTQAAGVTLALSTAAWLVLTRPSTASEERVFALSALLLIGGAADAMASSALLAGLTAGVFWRYARGRPREIVGRDVLFVQHPLLVLVMIVAGASVDLSLLSLALGLVYASLRTVGTIVGSAVATRTIALRFSSGLTGHLIRPGVFGVALALNAAGIAPGSDMSWLLATVVLGTIASELAAPVLLPRAGDL